MASGAWQRPGCSTGALPRPARLRERMAEGTGALTRPARLREKCLKNYVSSLNSRKAMVDEMSNFPTTMIFSRKSSWLNERLNLNLLRLASARMQLKPAHSAS